MTRRVVTGLDSEGRSAVLFDGPLPTHGRASDIIWRTATIPADNTGATDMAGPFDMSMMADGGSVFSMVTIPPGMNAPLHATDTVDYILILSGTIIFVVETGEVVLGPGDIMVDRGIRHGLRNDGAEPVVMLNVTIPAHPLYEGAPILAPTPAG